VRRREFIMRLNRVLLWAAAINIMIFAMVFTISCSGDDGKDGRSGTDGSSCTADKKGDKYEISCDGVVVGELSDGTNGLDGTVGKNGQSCWLGDKVGGSYQILCGEEGKGEVKGSLDVCSIENLNAHETNIICGTTTISMCDSKTYDPELEECDAKTGVKSLELECENGVKYTPKTQYCGYADKNAKKASPLYFCNLSKAVNKAEPNKEEWNNEYCRFTSDTTVVASAVFCEGKRLNDNDWKGEYCGYKSASASTKTVETDICGDGKGPNEEGYQKGYCQMEHRDSTRTVYTEVFCNGAGNSTARNTVNRVQKSNGKGIVVAADFPNEYCGYSSTANQTNDIKTTLKGACGDGKGPNEQGYNQGYCQMEHVDSTRTVYTEVFCNGAGNSTARNKINEATKDIVTTGDWKGQYCGFASLAAQNSDTKTMHSGACGDGKGPNEQGYAQGYCVADKDGKTTYTEDFCRGNGNTTAKGAPNSGSWKSEYCGFASLAAQNSDTKTVRTGICGDGRGPDEVGFGKGYCQVENKESKSTVYTEEFCGTGTAVANMVNQTTFQNHYCGYATKAAQDSDTRTRLNGGCDDGVGGPNFYGYNQGYCQGTRDSKMSTYTEVFCGTAKFNEGSWKNQYCFADNKLSTCAGGLIGDVSKNSNSADRCIYTESGFGGGDNTIGTGGNGSLPPVIPPVLTPQEKCSAITEGKGVYESGICTVDVSDAKEDACTEQGGVFASDVCEKTTNIDVSDAEEDACHEEINSTNVPGTFTDGVCTIQEKDFSGDVNLNDNSECVAITYEGGVAVYDNSDDLVTCIAEEHVKDVSDAKEDACTEQGGDFASGVCKKTTNIDVSDAEEDLCTSNSGVLNSGVCTVNLN
jgi:hypothetical protein